MKYTLRIMALFTAGVVLPVFADHLNVKPGLWETTNVQTHASGMIMPDLSRLPPDKQEEVRKAFTEMQTRQQNPHTYKYCLTEKDLANIDSMLSKSGDSRCQSQSVHHRGDLWSGTSECAGERATETVNWQFRILNSGHVTGKVNMTINLNGQTRDQEISIDSHWLGSDCGSVD